MNKKEEEEKEKEEDDGQEKEEEEKEEEKKEEKEKEEEEKVKEKMVLLVFPVRIWQQHDLLDDAAFQVQVMVQYIHIQECLYNCSICLDSVGWLIRQSVSNNRKR